MMTVGIDEVGRGCWAGPLVAGAVLLGGPIMGLKDSKKLSARQRTALDCIIRDQALAIGLGWVWPEEIDRIGLSASVERAMRLALQEISKPYASVIIDGNINYLKDLPDTQAVVKADDTEPSVSAASIVAKVARDTYMRQLAQKYPEYGFETHVGYGTASHSAALKRHGITPMHRRSYKPIQKLVILSST